MCNENSCKKLKQKMKKLEKQIASMDPKDIKVKLLREQLKILSDEWNKKCGQTGRVVRRT